MVKGMRPGGGGRRPPSPSVLDRILLRRIESSNLGSAATSTFPSPSDADDLVDHLRSRYPDYARIKLQPFSHRVRRILLQLHPVSNGDDEDEEDDDASGRTPSTPSRKRHRKRDEGRPQLFDPERPSQRRRKHRDRATTSSSDEDGVFDAAVDPEFDITKYMLREKYGKPKSTSKGEVEMENAVEKSKRRALGTADGSGVEEAPASQCRIGCGADSASDFGETDRPSFGDFGGIGRVLEELEMEVLVPLCHPQLPRWLGVRPTAGILLHGPPGCGKTRLAHAIANETGLPFYKISATEVVSGISGESEGNIRDLFNKAYRTAPSIVFIDEIDAIASKRENMQKEMERRIVTQLMTCMDASHQTPKLTNADSDSETSEKQLGYVLVIGATNRPDAVDPALRRPGRFDKEIALGVPDENARKEILSVITKKLRLDGTFNLLKIARTTPGFVGADLRALVDKAGNLAMKRIIDRRRSEFSRQRKKDDKKWWKQTWGADEYHNLSITMEDFEEAAKLVQPSLRREGFSSIPNVKWEDVGGLHILRKEFDRDIVQRIKNPEFFEELDETSGTGFLLYGPPGCGKTLIAKAVANEAGANFIHIKGPELLNKYVGESELAVRTIFTRARTCSPCILFFDEVDALTTKRGKDGGWVVERILDQLLVELDGADERCGVHVIGATNRLDVVDPAVLRPGRLGKVMYVPLPSADDRVMILKAIGRKKPLASNVDLEAIGQNEACTNFSGADLAALMKEAVMAAIDEKINAMHDGNLCTESSVIKSSHFEQALKKVRPSVSEKERMYYEVLSRTYRVT